jgi:hypothetical protein
MREMPGLNLSQVIGYQHWGFIPLPSYADEDRAECSETSAYKIQTPGNHPKESIQHSGHGESYNEYRRMLVIAICI